MRNALTVCVCILLVGVGYLYIGARQRAEEARLRVHSMVRVKWLAAAFVEYEKSHGTYPGTLAELEPLFGEKKGGRDLQMTYSILVSTAGPISFREVLANPLTGDNPGYEFVKPDGNSDRPVIYQLEKGKRTEAQAKGYLDGSVK